MKKLKLSKKAFSLAEVLITLGIIAVVATMTLPALMHNINNKKNSAILKEDYSILAQVVKSSTNDGANFEILALGSMTQMKSWFQTYLLPYMKVSNVCYDTQGCWTKKGVKALNGSIGFNNSSGKMGHLPICFVLYNGSNVCLDDRPRADMWTQWGVKVDKNGGNTMEVYVDVNGDKLPNTYGKDIFVFVADDEQFYPAGIHKTREEIEKDCSPSGKGYFCTVMAKNNGWNILNFK